MSLKLRAAESLGEGCNDGHDHASDRATAHAMVSGVRRIIPFDPTSKTATVMQHKPTLLRNQTLNSAFTVKIILVVTCFDFRYSSFSLGRAP
jgi:hypothetical protein